MGQKIALIGPGSTGKSTVFNMLKEGRLPYYKFISESTRVVAWYGFPINEQGTDLTQLAISSFHLKALLTTQDTIYDRSYLDLYVYTQTLNVEPSTLEYIKDVFLEVKDQYTLFVYFPIEFPTVEDGIRSTSEDWRHQVDRLFKECLDKYNLPYITVSGTPAERVSQIISKINNL